MQYFGYLRRDPDQGVYQFWLNILNNKLSNDPSGYRAMVCSFITSPEYQDRFGSLHLHSNAECGPCAGPWPRRVVVLVGIDGQCSTARYDEAACDGVFVHHFTRISTAVQCSGDARECGVPVTINSPGSKVQGPSSARGRWTLDFVLVARPSLAYSVTRLSS
jgi:hypothetical protein